MIAKLGSDASLSATCAPIPAAARSSISNRTTPARCFASPTSIRAVIGGQMWVAMDPPTARSGAAGRRAQRARLLDPRRIGARARASPAPIARRRNDARRDFSRMRAEFTRAPGKLCGARRRRVGPGDGRDDRRPVRLCARRRAHARHVRSGSMRSTTSSAQCRSSACSSAAAERRRVRHDLRGGRPAGQRRPCASIRCRWWRRASCARSSSSATADDRNGGAADSVAAAGSADATESAESSFVRRRAGNDVYTGFSSTCFLRPSESLITPSGVRSRGDSIIFSSVTAASLTFSPPPLIWRRASPFEATRPASRRRR